MANGTLEIKAVSGHAGPVAGRGASNDYDVCKLIDVTTCIGCKACEVACLEWNGYPFRETVFDNTYQTMPDTEWNYYNLIRFNEHVAEDGTFSWLMRKDGCMHCADPGCLLACPADGAIVQYANGIVDFNQDNCIGCQYCVTGCPFNIPKFNHETKKVYKCTGCLHFGSKADMLDLADKRVKQLHEHTSHKSAGVYDPAGVGGTHVMYVLHDIDHPERYGGLPKDPRIPLLVRIWKGPLKWLGNFALAAGILTAVTHFVRFGPKEVDEPKKEEPR